MQSKKAAAGKLGSRAAGSVIAIIIINHSRSAHAIWSLTRALASTAAGGSIEADHAGVGSEEKRLSLRWTTVMPGRRSTSSGFLCVV